MTTLITETTAPPGTQITPTPEPSAVDRARQYVVLREDENGWLEAGVVDEAIRKAAATQTVDPSIDTSGTLTYVAIPARSFQPVKVTARVEPKIEFAR